MANHLQFLTLAALTVVSTAFGTPAFAANVTGKVTDEEGNGIAAAIYADAPSGERTKNVGVAELHQKGKNFVPRTVVVEVDQPVKFPNDDFIFHNVFSVSKGNAFDLGLFKADTKYDENTLSKIEKGPNAGLVKFKQAGRVDVFCNIHPGMSAVVIVLPHAYHTRSQADGSFTLKVPAGTGYKVHAIDDAGNEVVVPAAVGALKIVFKDRKSGAPEHLNKEGKPYKPGESGSY